MNPRQAIRILMLSPCYWMLKVPARKILVEEYCATYVAVSINLQAKVAKQTHFSGKYVPEKNRYAFPERISWLTRLYSTMVDLCLF